MKKAKKAAPKRAKQSAKQSADPHDEAAHRSWTVMIYMVADDPAGGELLDQQANRELDQIVHAAMSADPDRENINVAVQIDFRSQPDVWRRLIGNGAWAQPESSAADPATLYGFFDWVARKCPADRYLLILWGHSRGPLGLFTDRPFSSPMAGPFARDDARRVHRANADAKGAPHRAPKRSRVSEPQGRHPRVQRLLHEHARNSLRTGGRGRLHCCVTRHRSRRGVAIPEDF